MKDLYRLRCLRKKGKSFLTLDGWGMTFGKYTLYENGRIYVEINDELLVVPFIIKDKQMWFEFDGIPIFSMDDYFLAKVYELNHDQKTLINVARFIYSMFANKEYHEITIEHIDGDFRNCSFNNLREKDSV